MKGCLSLPFRLLGLALLVLGGFLAWSNRDAIRRQVHQWTADSGAAEQTGYGDAELAAASHRKLMGVGRAGADSVVLSARDVANLIAAAAAERLPGALDSVTVRLERDAILVSARVDTRRVPLSFGPLSGMLRDREQVEAGGRLVFRRAGLAEWEVTHARVRGVPLPKDVIGRMLGAFSGSEAVLLPVPIPAAVGGLRVSPAGLVVYPQAAPGGAAR